MIRFRERGDKAGQRGTEQKSGSADTELMVGARHIRGWQGRRYTPWSCIIALILVPEKGMHLRTLRARLLHTRITHMGEELPSQGSGQQHPQRLLSRGMAWWRGDS